MDKNELIFIKKMFIREFNEEININNLNILLENRNKIVLRRLTHLGNIGNSRLTKEIVKLFFHNNITGQISVLISLGQKELCKRVLHTLEKDINVEDDLFVEILKTALKNCVYVRDVFAKQTKMKLEAIWSSLKYLPDKKGNKIAQMTYDYILNDDRTNNILKKAILEAYENVYNFKNIDF